MTKNHNTPKPYATVGVLGAGAWGTALALVAARTAHRINVWTRESDVAKSIAESHENLRYLKGVPLPPALSASTDIAPAAASEALLVAVPAQALRATLALLPARATETKAVVLCAKGIEKSTGLLVTEVLREALPGAEAAILSGPSFAQDVARGAPTAITIAGAHEIVVRLQATLGSETFRPYESSDLTGVALGGAAKNVYAIATGIADGLGLGESARAGLLARSFAELMRLGATLGAKRETLMGLSGLGDLVLTATSPTSRNFSFGLQLGRGASLASLSAKGHPLAEGVDTAPALVKRAGMAGVELPIAETVAAILDGSLTARDAIVRLMSRPLRKE
jgi:glycerol-3-phosphate dehydrogenase (NAD(P)+)